MALFEHPQATQQYGQHRKRTSVTTPVQAPVGGWNTRDAFDDVPPEDAIQMENWLPSLGSVRVREGAALHCIGSDDPLDAYEAVKTLAVFRSGGTTKLIAFEDSGNVFDATTGTPALLASGFSTGVWDWAMFGGFLVAVNGTDDPQEWDGTTWQDLTPGLTGPTNPVGCHSYKNRMYYWDAASQSIWYTELLARGGTCNEFDLSKVSKYGGYLMAVETWTQDGGNGPDDYIIFLMSSGEAIVYRGSSPSSVADWSIVGIFYIGTPLGPRCLTKFGGDLFIMTTLDIINLGSMIKGPEALAARSKISGAMEQIAFLAGTFGFDSIMYPTKKIAVFNIPESGGTTFAQYALNIITGAWAKLTGWTAYCWQVVDDEIFFGSNYGAVMKAFTGSYDETVYDNAGTYDTRRTAINSMFQTSWLNFGSPENKTFHAMKPIFRAKTAISLNAAFAVDFGVFPALDYPVADELDETPWGSPWGSPWGPVTAVDADWEIIEGYGRWISVTVKTASEGELALASSLWHIEAGIAM